jgi:polyketide biosynthesis acyl carrier protein
MVFARQNTLGELFTLFKQQVHTVLPNIPSDQITLENSLHVLGANSIDRADIIVNMLEGLDLYVPLVIFVRAKNIGELLELILEQQQSQARCSCEE